MLVELLGRGAVPIVFCTERAREFGISERTLFKARSKLPIKVVHVPCTGGRAYWELANGYHGKRFTCETDAPSWRPPRPARPCADCGEAMHDGFFISAPRLRNAGAGMADALDAFEKLADAVDALEKGAGSVHERLFEAFTYLVWIGPEDIPVEDRVWSKN